MKTSSCPRQKPTPDEYRRFIHDLARFVVDEMFRLVNLSLAKRWIAEHLRPAKRPHPLGVGFWKHDYEWNNGRCGRYIRKGDFATLLMDAGIRVKGDRVYCKEIRS